MLLATTQLERRLQPRVSPSDIVQETMLRAHRHFAQFRGQSERELLAWLRQILVTNLAKFVERYVLAAKRDIRREISIERPARPWPTHRRNCTCCSAAAAERPAPPCKQREEAVLLADRLAELPNHYREVLVLRNIRGLSFEEVAAQIERPLGATRMLWLRAIKRLRMVYRKAEEQDA